MFLRHSQSNCPQIDLLIKSVAKKSEETLRWKKEHKARSNLNRD